MSSINMNAYMIAAQILGMEVEELLEILDTDLSHGAPSVEEIIEAVEDCDGDDDWVAGGDSCADYCDSYSYYPY